MTEPEASPSPKRDHDTYAELDLEEPCSVPAEFLEKLEREERAAMEPAENDTRGQSPDASNVTTAQAAPSAFTAMNGIAAPPPPKKAKLTFAEKEARRVEKEFRDKVKAEEKAKKEAERLAHAEEKARRDAEKESERKRKEAEKEEKRMKIESEKEERKKKTEEERKKKDKGQMKLPSFFAAGVLERDAERTSISPAPTSSALTAVASPAATSTPKKKDEKTPYEKLFLGFCVREDVSMAPINRFERDEEAVEATQNAIDAYILGDRSPGRQRTFDPIALFHLQDFTRRGKNFMPVKEIMSEFLSGNASQPIDLTTDSQNSQIKRRGDLLRTIPLKFLQFQEDVRPPYRGTYTSRPISGMTKLARNPLRRDLPNTDYDYDSEAEWVEDDGEDLKSQGDEEEELDDDEDMEGFLDDENDETANSRRLVLQGDLEPVSTGLCWEDRKKRNSNVKMISYRMEVILDPAIKSIDPFSTTYWDPIPSTMDPPRIPLNPMKNGPNVHVAITGKPVKPFFTAPFDIRSQNPMTQPQPSTLSTVFPSPSKPTTSNPTISKSSNPKSEKETTPLIPAEDIPSFKREIEGSDLSKLGLIEVLKKKFPGRSAKSIKATLEVVAVRGRRGEKEKEKRWLLRGGGGEGEGEGA